MKIGKVINHNIMIEPTANFGFIAKVGCGTFSFADKEALVFALREFLDDPKAFEKLYDSVSGPVPEEATSV